MLQAHQLLTALGGKPGTSEAGAGLPRSGPGSTNKDDDSISSDGDGDDSDGDGKGDGKGRTGTGAGKRLRYEDLQVRARGEGMGRPGVLCTRRSGVIWCIGCDGCTLDQSLNRQAGSAACLPAGWLIASLVITSRAAVQVP